SLNRIDDREVDEFLEAEFDAGLRERTWLFLFDSFDEIPAILNSTEADGPIANYASAISDFLHGMNACTGIIPSREFRGPAGFGWPRFWILPLDDRHREMLVRKADLSPDAERSILRDLATATPDMLSMANNPLFLSLLLENARAGNPFPKSPQLAYE